MKEKQRWVKFHSGVLSEKRFFDLALKLGNRREALGALAEAFIHAQEHWLSSKGLGIPREIWVKQGLADELIEVGLAVDNGEYVYVAGSKEAFLWLDQRKDAADARWAMRSHPVASGRNADESGRNADIRYKSTTTTNTILCSTPSGVKHNTNFDLEGLFKNYPKRNGSLNKKVGLSRFAKLITNQETYDRVFKAVLNYRSWAQREGKVGTEFVAQLSKFFSVWEEWEFRAEEKTTKVDVSY